jgi:hypothetical protein
VPTAAVGTKPSGYEDVGRGQLAVGTASVVGTAPVVGIAAEATVRARRRHERPAAQM